MSEDESEDAKDELAARFENRRPSSEREQTADTTEASKANESDQATVADQTDETIETVDSTGDQTDEPLETNKSIGTDESFETDKSQSDTNAEGQSDGTFETTQSDEPDQSEEETVVRNRKQVAMLVPKEQREALHDFYDELDARAKLAGEGGLKKHAEFYEELVDFVLDRREEFAKELEIEISDQP